jgi:hypothetical protein
VPLGGLRQRFRCEGVGLVAGDKFGAVLKHVLAAGEQFQVAQFAVAPIVVAMVDDMPFRNWTIGLGPYAAMQQALAEPWLAGAVVAASFLKPIDLALVNKPLHVSHDTLSESRETATVSDSASILILPWP